jgi:hypothetical protein
MFSGASADLKKGFFIGLGVGGAVIVLGMVSGVFRKV